MMNVLASNTYIEDIENICKFDLPWQKLAGRSVLITGSTGLICSCIADILLIRNNRFESNIRLVLAGRSRKKIVERFKPFEEEKDYHFAYFDAVSGNAPNTNIKFDYIIHGASNAHPAEAP